MDPISAALQLLTSINNIIAALLSKASTPTIDLLITQHIEHRERVETILDTLFRKTFPTAVVKP